MQSGIMDQFSTEFENKVRTIRQNFT